MKLLLSGYGGVETDSIGLYHLGKDCEKKQLLWSSSNISASSFLSVYDDLLFGISEKGDGGCIYMFRGENDGYRLIDSAKIQGKGLCHIAYLPQNQVLVGSCYGSGDVFSIKVEKQGFGQMLSYIRQGDVSVEETRVHCAVYDREEKGLFAVNIALDRVYRYDIKKGALVEKGYLQLEKGEGPRHALLSPEANLMYIITEYSNRIIIARIGEAEFEVIDGISTLPEGFDGKSFGSSLCLTKDSRYLYGANRGANTIAVFQVKKNGLLEKIADHHCFGDWPRHITLAENDRYLVIANQNSNEVVIAQRDGNTGLITGEAKRIGFDRPSFVIEKQ